MSVIEIQHDLIKKILQTEDLYFLRRLQEFFQLPSETTDWWFTISEEEKEMIEIGNRELEEGKGVPYEEVRKAVKERLEKYKK